MIAIVIIVITMALGGLAAWRVRSAFSHWSGVAGSSGLTGAETAAAILRASGISNVRRQVFWGNWRRELTEALAHQGCHFRRPRLDEASGVV